MTTINRLACKTKRENTLAYFSTSVTKEMLIIKELTKSRLTNGLAGAKKLARDKQTNLFFSTIID
jgi:hypothetical protein